MTADLIAKWTTNVFAQSLFKIHPLYSILAMLEELVQPDAPYKRRFTELCTSDAYSKTEKSLLSSPPLSASDRYTYGLVLRDLSPQFGVKKIWPVYMTFGTKGQGKTFRTENHVKSI